ncbi:uncharacterized protein LOC108672151 [Hyalella azteca]|uniref:Uncharacterized protein LOC108672151 n=1 Tax=Hyalella azteca TaxID=294128 RepID=A0A8B7NQ87_HYAAZ|nr:uncharacterized protein LOC108672151 [Hyalella azteca]
MTPTSTPIKSHSNSTFNPKSHSSFPPKSHSNSTHPLKSPSSSTLAHKSPSSSTLPHKSPSSQPYTPKALLQRYSLPLAVRLHAPTPTPSGVDPRRPLLLYRTSHTPKVRAESLRVATDGTYMSVGQPLVVPESYTGWFSVVQASGGSATAYTSIAEVISTRPAAFLTRYDLPAYIATREGTAKYHQGTVQGGEVLQLVAVVSYQREQFAQCLNYQHQMALVSVNAVGKFYHTADKNTRDTDKVYLLTHLLRAFQLPLTVKLVCGYMPRTPCAFTGILRLLRCQKESVVVACTMTSQAEATLMEMDLSSSFLLSPILDPLFPKSPIYLKTLSYCEDEATDWQRQIKVTHHVTDQRSRSLTRSFSDKFVDVPACRSMSAFSTLDRVKPRRSMFTQSVTDTSIGRLASKINKMKESRKRESISEKYRDNNGLGHSFEQIVCPNTKLFEKQRSLSKQNTFVQEINRKNRPLPDTSTKTTTTIINLKHSLNSLRRGKKIGSRPLPTPCELLVTPPDDSQPSLTTYKFIKTSKDGIEYCRVSDNSSPAPTSLGLEDSDMDDDGLDEDTENLYSEIEDLMSNKMDLDFSDEERDSASSSNGNSSNGYSSETKMTRKNRMFLNFKGTVSQDVAIKAEVHSRNRFDSPKSVAESEDDHYATITLNEDDDDSEQDIDKNRDSYIQNMNKANAFDDFQKQELKEAGAEDSVSIKGDWSDSLENVSALPNESKIQTFVDQKGAVREKYFTRQRSINIYETLEEAVENSKHNSSTNDSNQDSDDELIGDSSSPRERPLNEDLKKVIFHDIEDSAILTSNEPIDDSIADEEAETDLSPSLNTTITMVEDESRPGRTSISITEAPFEPSGNSTRTFRPVAKPSLGLTSACSIADLCNADEEEDYEIQMRGNTILIKVCDDSSVSRDTSFDTEMEKSNDDMKPNLKKCSSVSSINILLDDNEDFCTHSEHVRSEETCNEISYLNESCVSISIINRPENLTIAKLSSDIVEEMYGKAEEPYKSIGTLLPNNELRINTEENHFANTPTSEMDQKSLDSGNASDEVEDQEDSFDADSLADEECESPRIVKKYEGLSQDSREEIHEELNSDNEDTYDDTNPDNATESYDFTCPQDIEDDKEDGEEKIFSLTTLTSKYEISIMEPILEEDSYDSEANESFPNSPRRLVYQNMPLAINSDAEYVVDIKKFSAELNVDLLKTSDGFDSSPQCSNENQYENVDPPAQKATAADKLMKFETSLTGKCRSSLKSVEPLDLEHPFLLAEALSKDFPPTNNRMSRTLPRSLQTNSSFCYLEERTDLSLAPLYQNVTQPEEPSSSVYENVTPTPSLCSAALYANTPSPSDDNRTVTSFSYISLSPRSPTSQIQNNHLPGVPFLPSNHPSRVSADLPRDSLKSFYNSPFSLDGLKIEEDELYKTPSNMLTERPNIPITDPTPPTGTKTDASSRNLDGSSDSYDQSGSSYSTHHRKVSSLSSDSGCLSSDESEIPTKALQTDESP